MQGLSLASMSDVSEAMIAKVKNYCFSNSFALASSYYIMVQLNCEHELS